MLFWLLVAAIPGIYLATIAYSALPILLIWQGIAWFRHRVLT